MRERCGAGTPPRRTTMIRLTPDILLEAYAAGIFPMAESADDSKRRR